MAEGSVMETDLERLARLEKWLHERSMHPDFEYETTKGPRKAWEHSAKPPDTLHSWERNRETGREGWERFDYYEESYWRRRKGTK